jgi:hypothetical protein
MYLKGEFTGIEATALAIEALKARGVAPEEIAVFSTEPVEFPPGVLDRPSRMSLFAVAGAVTIGLGATGYVYFVQHHYPIVTGGMPIFSLWATGVISYEMTLLGAIASTFLFFLWESGRLQRDKTVPVPQVEPGTITLRVYCRPAELAEIGGCLYRAGAARVQKLEAKA